MGMPFEIKGQPGRYIAIFVVVPLLLFSAADLVREGKGCCNQKCEAATKRVAALLVGISLLLFSYEILWLTGSLVHADRRSG